MLHRFLPELQCKAACRRDPFGQPLPIHGVGFRIDCIQPAPERFVYPLIPFFLRRTPDLFFFLAVSAACYKNAPRQDPNFLRDRIAFCNFLRNAFCHGTPSSSSSAVCMVSASPSTSVTALFCELS